MKRQYSLSNGLSSSKRLFSLILGGLLFLLLAAGCGQPAEGENQSAEPANQAMATNTEAAGPSEALAEQGVIQVVAAGQAGQVTAPTAQAELPFPVGSLLKTADDPGVFRLHSDGTRQHIYDWGTYLAFGFKPKAIVTVQTEWLETIPMSGELSRLVYDSNGWHYWAVDGSLWRVPAWDKVVSGADYQGAPATPIDPLLLNRLPIRRNIPDNVIMRDGTKLVIKRAGEIHLLNSYLTALAFGFKSLQFIEVPTDVFAELTGPKLKRLLMNEDVPFEQAEVYQIRDGKRYGLSKAQLSRQGYSRHQVSPVSANFLLSFPAVHSLRIADSGANLRQGPSTDFAVIHVASSYSTWVPLARNEDASWYQVAYRGQTAWVAASVSRLSGSVDELPVESVGQPKTAAVAVAVTPTPVATPATPQPLSCEEVPIRGFGKVWADHPEIHPSLGCPAVWNGGERGTQAAAQYFEHGMMVWVAQDRVQNVDPVYVLFYEDNTYQRFGDLGPADPEKVGGTDPGFHPVGDKFSKVYWEGTGARVKERLGRATSQAVDSPGAFQGFGNGRMLWVGQVDLIFVIYDHGYYDSNNQWTRVKAWASYKDTF